MVELTWASAKNFGVKLYTTILSIFVLFCGALTAITVTFYCLVLGIYLMILGIILFAIEGPFLGGTNYFDTMVKVSNKLPTWTRALIFFLAPIPIFGCLEIYNIVCIVLMWLAGLFYGTIAYKEYKSPASTDLEIQPVPNSQYL